MGEMTVKREIGIITAEIITIRENTNRMVLENSIEIGRRLVEAKEVVGHGGWGDYLRDKVAFSASTANNLMKLYQEYGDTQLELGKPPKSQTFGNLTYSQAVALLALPEAAREELVAEHDMETTSVRELQAIIEEKKREAEAARKEAETAKRDADDARHKLDRTGEELAKRDMDLIAAEKKIKELESRPVDVAVQTPSEEQLKAIRKDAKIKAEEKFRGQVRVLEKELSESRRTEEQQTARAAELEKRLAVAGDSGTLEFNLLLHSLQETLNKMYRKYQDIQAENPEQGKKLQGAMMKFAGMLAERWETEA